MHTRYTCRESGHLAVAAAGHEPLGMDDALTATFCSIDWKKKRLTIAAENQAFDGDADNGWRLIIDNTKAVPFNFLNKVRTDNRVAFVVVSYMAKS